MTTVRLSVLLGLAALAAAPRAEAYEDNYWPAVVQQKDEAGQTLSWSGAGPFLFSRPSAGPEAGTEEGFRPFYAKITGGGSVRYDFLYPLFFYRQYPDAYKWSVFELINGAGYDEKVTRAGGPKDRHFDVWPFYFSHESDTREDTYHALFPVAGQIKYRLGFTRASWVLFPLFAQTEKRHTISTYTPWPIIRTARGESNGFDLWPLFGSTSGPGPARRFFALWPLIWNNVLEPKPNAPEGSPPGREFGFLPFYTRETGPGYLNENYVWPFFGHTERTLPARYSEQRYLWPFLVQGRGDGRYVNRWGPFFTHSNVKGEDSKWVLWPLWHQKRWVDGDTDQQKTQFFYFLYWSLYETSDSRPSAPPAYKRHVWPVASIWDNGAGSRQVQVPSPLEVFFPDNRDIRASWTPLFSLYRYDREPTGEVRQSLLWNAVTWRRFGADGLVEFHVGPLLGMRPEAGGRAWTILGFDFGGKHGKDGGSTR
ncbi:MAG TPA: hypothetical protein VGG37_04475 [Opitutaceae bacterium]|jgi:hypothetical protein